MASEIINRDQNFRTVGGAVTNDASQDISMLRVDPTTKYLLVNISNIGATSANSNSIAQRDGNFRTVCLAYDEDNDELVEVLTDSDGRLLCDVEFI